MQHIAQSTDSIAKWAQLHVVQAEKTKMIPGSELFFKVQDDWLGKSAGKA